MDLYHEFFLNTPLYSKFEVEGLDEDFISSILGGSKVKFDGYNPSSGCETTYILNVNWSSHIYENGGRKEGFLLCSRTGNRFFFTFHWYPKADKPYLLKVGQYPSLADFHIGEISQYSKVLPKPQMQEFTKAMGLAAHGIGIGSFVYMRRIFEFLIEEAYQQSLADNTVTEEEYFGCRMDGRVALLKAHLPPFLVENHKMYSILSKGIHELEEAVCLKYYKPLRASIEIILDQRLEEKKRADKEAETRRNLAGIVGELNGGTPEDAAT